MPSANIRSNPVENDTIVGDYRMVESLLPFYPADLARYDGQGWRMLTIVVKAEHWYLHLKRKDKHESD